MALMIMTISATHTIASPNIRITDAPPAIMVATRDTRNATAIIANSINNIIIFPPLISFHNMLCIFREKKETHKSLIC